MQKAFCLVCLLVSLALAASALAVDTTVNRNSGLYGGRSVTIDPSGGIYRRDGNVTVGPNGGVWRNNLIGAPWMARQIALA